MSEEKKDQPIRQPTQLESMEMERNQRMMVLMTALRDYIGAVNAEINELRNLSSLQEKAAKDAARIPSKREKKGKINTIETQ